METTRPRKTIVTEAALAEFRGTEYYYPCGLDPRIKFTDGAKYLFDHAGAYWLQDVIISHQLLQKVQREEFQVWTLTVKDNSGCVVCTDGNDNIISQQIITYTDFPMRKVCLYLSNNVLYLPTEH